MQMTKVKNIEHTDIYFILCTKAFAATWASKRLMYGGTRHLHCSGVILAYSSTKSLNLDGSVGRLYELWFLVLSTDSTGQVIQWATIAALFSVSETTWNFPWLCVRDHRLAEMSILVLSSSFCQMAANSSHWFLGTFSIHRLFSYMKSASTTC